MDNICWEFYPHVAENLHARNWLETQMLLGLAQSTIHAYGRGANDYLAFCQRTACSFIEATKADIVAYIDDMTHRSNPRGDNIRYLHSGVGLANSTMQQRLTVVRLLYDYLIDERIRLDQRNPVGKGKFTPGRAFAGRRRVGSDPRCDTTRASPQSAHASFRLRWSFTEKRVGGPPGTRPLVASSADHHSIRGDQEWARTGGDVR